MNKFQAGQNDIEASKNEPNTGSSSTSSQEPLIPGKNSNTPSHVPTSMKTKEFMQVLRAGGTRPKNPSTDNTGPQNSNRADSQISSAASKSTDISEEGIDRDDKSKKPPHISLESYMKLLQQNDTKQVDSHA